MIVEDIIIRLRIEEDNKAVEKRSLASSIIVTANIIEDRSSVIRKVCCLAQKAILLK